MKAAEISSTKTFSSSTFSVYVIIMEERKAIDHKFMDGIDFINHSTSLLQLQTITAQTSTKHLADSYKFMKQMHPKKGWLH